MAAAPTATVNLTVEAGVNDDPTANNDSFNATEDQPLVLTAAQLLANDSIAPDSGETLSIQSVQGAVNGSVALNPNTNQITFTPTANYFGPGLVHLHDRGRQRRQRRRPPSI